MGRAARWLRGLLGGKKPSSGAGTAGAEPKPAKEKRRWGFGLSSSKEKAKTLPVAGVAPPRRRPYSSPAAAAEEEEEQSKRAIAVAAATAAVAEAAVAAAQAAAAVVRLTSSGRSPAGAAAFAGGGGCGKMEEWAAVKIQAAFRGYLARRALKALRGLVKLQALVRGNIVRRQAAETLRCMHALVRVQGRARACRALRTQRCNSDRVPRGAHPGSPTPEKYDQMFHADGPKSDRSGSLKRSSSKSSAAAAERVSRERSQSCGRNWLDRWMEERYLDDEKNAKVLEVDTGKPSRYNSRRKGNSNHLQSSCSTLTSDQNSRSFATMPDSPSKDSTAAQKSVPSPSSVDMGEALSPLRLPVEIADLCDSPQFYSAISRPGSSRRGAFTPSKSECSRSLFGGYSDYPNYMANTESFRAKARSHSAPKQRPQYDKSGSLRKASAYCFGPQQLSAAPAQRSSSLHAKFTNKAYPGSGRLDRLGMPIKY